MTKKILALSASAALGLLLLAGTASAQITYPTTGTTGTTGTTDTSATTAADPSTVGVPNTGAGGNAMQNEIEIGVSLAVAAAAAAALMARRKVA